MFYNDDIWLNGQNDAEFTFVVDEKSKEELDKLCDMIRDEYKKASKEAAEKKKKEAENKVINNIKEMNSCQCKNKDDNITERNDTRSKIEKMVSETASIVLPKNDRVNHPKHYTDGKYECIDVMLDVFGIEAVKDFCYLNCFKYLWRSLNKNGIEDVEKCRWYLNKYIDLSKRDIEE
jgi:hypothetical protein